MTEPRVLKVLLADDELVARRRLARLLAAIPDVALVAEHVDAEGALERLREGDVDVALLDVHMPGLSGIDVLAALGDDAGAAPLVIFCTAHQDHAVDAFAGGAVDYLLKPIELARLRKAIERARARLLPPAIESPSAAVALPPRLALETRQGLVLIDPARITHAVLDGALVTLATLDGEHVTELTLQELERRLGEGRLMRVHRRALLALEHVVWLEPIETGGYVAHTVRGHAVEVSRQVARELRKRLGV